MNARLPWLPALRVPQRLRVVLRHGTRVSHLMFTTVGLSAIVAAIVLWVQPAWRGQLAARLMPVLSAAAQSGPAMGRLLIGPIRSASPFETTRALLREPSGLDLAASAVASASRLVALPVVTAPDSTAVAASSDTRTADAANDASARAVSLDDADSSGSDIPSIAPLARLIPSARIAADAKDPQALASTVSQSRVAGFLARRYRVAAEPVAKLVGAAYETGREAGLDPLLILSVIAIESGFNPYAESGMGAQGLMQVMSKVHSDKFEYFGGTSAALKPLANIKVGALILKDCIARGGSLPSGLRLYNGSTSPTDNSYNAKVLAERNRLRDVARGRSVPINAPQGAPVVTASVKAAARRAAAVRDEQDSAASAASTPATEVASAGDTAAPARAHMTLRAVPDLDRTPATPVDQSVAPDVSKPAEHSALGA